MGTQEATVKGIGPGLVGYCAGVAKFRVVVFI